MFATRYIMNKSKLTPFVSLDLIVFIICGITIIEKRNVAIQPNTCESSIILLLKQPINKDDE